MQLKEISKSSWNPFCYWILSAIILSVIGSILAFFFAFGIKPSDYLTLEQTMFVMATSILIIFREFVFSFSAISRMRNNINTIKKSKEKLLFSSNGSKDKDFDDYVNTLEVDMSIFVSSTGKIKKVSSYFYIAFIILGLIGVTIILNFGEIELNSIIARIVAFVVYAQILLIAVWGIAGIREERRKVKMNNFFEDENIIKDFKRYFIEQRDRPISLSLGLDKIP